MNDITSQYADSLIKWVQQVDLLGLLTTALVAYVIFKITSPIVGWLTKHAMRHRQDETRLEKIERTKRAKTLANLFSFVIKTVIVVTAVYTILTDLGVKLEPILAGASIASVALGFGAQSIIKDMLAGFFIILENQYRVDDVVRISGVGIPTDVEGTVRSITLRRTTLRDRNGNVHTIPNGQIIEVTNRTLGYSRFRFVFAVDIDTDVDEIIRIVNDTGEKMAKDPHWDKDIVDAPHYDEFGKIGKQGINVTVGGTTTPGNQWRVSAEYRKRLVSELQKSSIDIADVES